MAQKEYDKKRYHERKEKGLCVKCGNEKDDGMVLCQNCRAKNSTGQRESYRYYQMMGICPRCKKEKLYGDERACLMCSAERYSRQLKRDKEHANEIHRKSSRKIYAESSSKGICTRCNKRKAAEGQKRCKMCVEKSNAYRLSKRESIPRKLRPDFGLCYHCGDAVKEGQRVCAKCHEKITEGNRKQDRSGRSDFKFGRAMYDWELRKVSRKEKVG